MKIHPALLAIFLFLSACNNSTQDNNKKSNIDTVKHSDSFNGTFTGITPCADCPGINTAIVFFPDGAFSEHLKYMERDSDFQDSGKWIIKDSLITATYEKGNHRYFKVISDSTIKMLDGDGNEITGSIGDHYVLKRTDTLIEK